MNNPGERIKSIDALRGLAVILMVEQHLGFWLWKRPSLAFDFSKYPVLIGFNAMGGFAAPAFITLAGVGIAFFFQRHNNTGKILLSRGLTLIAFGYLLNILVPSWFSPGSWYVLHMIGFGIALSPVLKKINRPMLFVIIVFVIIFSVVIQNLLNTPSYLSNKYMGNFNMPGGVLRLILAEGQFPIFPWLSLFITGIISGEWILKNDYKKLITASLFFFSSSFILAVMNLLGYSFVKEEMLKRFFTIQLGFYPANPPIILLLMGIVLLSIPVFMKIENRFSFSSSNPLVCLGRVSLTILFVHVVLFRQLGKGMGIWQFFSSGTTLFIIFIVIFVFAILSIMWRKKNFKFSLEWLLRKIAG